MVNVLQLLLEYHDKNELDKDLSLRRVVPNIKKRDAFEMLTRLAARWPGFVDRSEPGDLATDGQSGHCTQGCCCSSGSLKQSLAIEAGIARLSLLREDSLRMRGNIDHGAALSAPRGPGRQLPCP